jgi:hypothetical protein
MKLIESKTLGTSAASIEFTSIPQTFTDLVVLVSGRGDNAATHEWMELTFNSNTSSYSYRVLQGNGGGAASFSGSARYAGDIPAASSTSNTFGNNVVYIPNYTGSTNKSFSVDSVTERNDSNAIQNIVAGLWSNTSAITTLSIAIRSGNLVAGSIVSLYGVLKGSDGIVTTS